jgi:hypothetical protein
MNPRNILDGTQKAHFEGFNFIWNFLSTLKAYSMSFRLLSSHNLEKHIVHVPSYLVFEH